MEKWHVEKSQYLFREPWLTVRADTCTTDRGHTVDPYYILEYTDWVHAVALDDDNRVLLVRQYRHAAGEFCTELPGGVMEAGEDPVTAAARELKEETGYEAAEWTYVTRLRTNAASHTNHMHCCLARGIRKTGDTAFDASENIESLLVPAAELPGLVDGGGFTQSMHLACMLLCLRRAGLGALFS